MSWSPAARRAMRVPANAPGVPRRSREPGEGHDPHAREPRGPRRLAPWVVLAALLPAIAARADWQNFNGSHHGLAGPPGYALLRDPSGTIRVGTQSGVGRL